MKTPLALLNLWHQGAKTIVNIVGVAFALLLVFMQLGFQGAVSHTATNVLSNLDFELVVRSRSYEQLYEPGTVDCELLNRIQSAPGVLLSRPFWVTVQQWRTMQPGDANLVDANDAAESVYLPIAVMSAYAADRPFVAENLNADLARVAGSDMMLIDDSTQADYGPVNGKNFTDGDVGRETEIGGSRFRVVGLYELGTGLAANGAMITNPQGFQRVFPWDVREKASLGLISVDPTDADQTKLAVQRIVCGEDGCVADVLTKEQALEFERQRWLWQTPIGLIFQLGVVLSLLVGAAIVYMILSTDVANRLPEYATLLAMGYSRFYLASIVMTQALALCGLGFALAWVSAEGLYRATTAFSAIPLEMTPVRVMIVAVLGVVMCCVSGLLALRKLWKAEPANLF